MVCALPSVSHARPVVRGASYPLTLSSSHGRTVANKSLGSQSRGIENVEPFDPVSRVPSRLRYHGRGKVDGGVVWNPNCAPAFIAYGHRQALLGRSKSSNGVQDRLVHSIFHEALLIGVPWKWQFG